jgi:hypothetical protein
MAHRESSLIEQIEQDALSESTSLSTALRKCVALGGRVNSSHLRDWATKELRGYEPTDDIPTYQSIIAPIMINGTTIHAIIRGQRISRDVLPDVVRERIDEHVELREPIAQLEELVQRARSGNEPVRLSLPGSPHVVQLMNYEMGDRFQRVTEVYWSVDASSLTAVIDKIRTTLVELIAELRRGMNQSESLPTPDLAEHAVNVAVHGRRSRVTVHTAQATNGATASIVPSSATNWSMWRRLGAFIVGLATVAATIIALIRG